MIYLIIFIIGAFLSSFLNVIIDRLPRKETIARGRSYCEFCKKELAWYDLIPLLSFLFLKGKCRYCGKPIGWYYPIIELSTAVLFTITSIFVNFQFSIFNFQSISQFPISNEFLNHKSLIINLVYYLFLVSSFIIIFFTDLKYGIIPDKVILPAVLTTFFWLIVYRQDLILNHVLSGAVSFVFFISISLVFYVLTKKESMGAGDIKLAFLLGLFLGFPKIILALYLAFLTGAFIGLILILWKKKSSIKDTIPFGPFLITGTLLSLFLGDLMLPKIITFLGF